MTNKEMIRLGELRGRIEKIKHLYTTDMQKNCLMIEEIDRALKGRNKKFRKVWYMNCLYKIRGENTGYNGTAI